MQVRTDPIHRGGTLVRDSEDEPEDCWNDERDAPNPIHRTRGSRSYSSRPPRQAQRHRWQDTQ
jgi:hypothetical protein